MYTIGGTRRVSLLLLPYRALFLKNREGLSAGFRGLLSEEAPSPKPKINERPAPYLIGILFLPLMKLRPHPLQPNPQFTPRSPGRSDNSLKLFQRESCSINAPQLHSRKKAVQRRDFPITLAFFFWFVAVPNFAPIWSLVLPTSLARTQ